MKKFILPLLAFAFLFFIACGNDSTKATDSSNKEVPPEVASFMELTKYNCSETENYCKITLIQEDGDSVQCTGKIWTPIIPNIPTTCDILEEKSEEAIDPTDTQSEENPTDSPSEENPTDSPSEENPTDSPSEENPESLLACEVTGIFSTCFYTSSKSQISLIEEQCSLMEGTIISDCSAYPNCEASEGNKGVFSCEIK